ncbi:MAG TPA: DUF58 domain-containing protein [Polyangiaceae bacterium]
MAPLRGLLDPDFMRELEALRRRLEVRARSAGPGVGIARRRGSSAEFEEHRAYEPGDDLRRIDWLAFARKGAPVVKQFRAEEDYVLRLLVDASASLGFGDPSKIEVSRRLAAALGYMALRSSERVQVLVATQPDPSARALARAHPLRRGRSGLPALLRDLDAVAAAGQANLARAIDETVERSRKPGLLVVLSDFFDGGPVTLALSRARAAQHDVALVQVTSDAEVNPSYEGDFALVDSETGQSVDVTLDAAALEAYVLRYTGLVEELRGFARKHSATYVRALNTEPLEPVVRRFVARAID